VRGVIAAALGLNYWGCDLSSRQVDENRKQGLEIPTEGSAEWVCGDAMEVLEQAPGADFIFTCPPYGDMEQYSEDPHDLSTMEWHTFRAAYRRIILRALARLKPDRFACFVVGDFRDPGGRYRGFVSETIAAFTECGAAFYNDAVLVTAVGTASLRATRQFNGGRKLVKTHQNVLVFVKGDWRRAAAACRGEVWGGMPRCSVRCSPCCSGCCSSWCNSIHRGNKYEEMGVVHKARARGALGAGAAGAAGVDAASTA